MKLGRHIVLILEIVRHMSGEQEMYETKKGKVVVTGWLISFHCTDALKSVKYATDACHSCLWPCNV